MSHREPFQKFYCRDDLLFPCCHFMLVCCLPAFCLVASQDAMDAKNVVTYKAIKPRTSFTSSCSTTGEDSESLLERNQVLRRRHVWRELILSNYNLGSPCYILPIFTLILPFGTSAEITDRTTVCGSTVRLL